MSKDQFSVVIIIGLPGSGKTTCGKLLSKRLGFRFIDSDKLIEQSEGMAVRDIFSRLGEPHFRSLERDVLRHLEKRLSSLRGDHEKNDDAGGTPVPGLAAKQNQTVVQSNQAGAQSNYIATTGIEGNIAIEVLHALKSKGLVLAVGGGMPEPEENRQRLKRLGTVVYLFSDPNEIAVRLKEDGARPLLSKTGSNDAKVSNSHENQSINSENEESQKISSKDLKDGNNRNGVIPSQTGIENQTTDNNTPRLLDRLEGLLDRRRQAYESADITIDTSGLDPHQIVNRLQEALKTHQQIL